jgi:hypothetical protein
VVPIRTRFGVTLLVLVTLVGCTTHGGHQPTPPPPTRPPPADPAPTGRFMISMTARPSQARPGQVVRLAFRGPRFATGVDGFLQRWDGTAWQNAYLLWTLSAGVEDLPAAVPWPTTSLVGVTTQAYGIDPPGTLLAFLVPPAPPGEYRVSKEISNDPGEGPHTPALELFARLQVLP